MSEKQKEEEDGYFSQQQIMEEVQQRTLIKLDEPNPIYTKPSIQEPTFYLKLIQQSSKPDYVSSYIPFKLNNKQEMETINKQHQFRNKFRFQSPFTQYYEADQLVYQRYHNDAFTRFKEIRYYCGFFIPKNLIYDSIKQSSCSLHQICDQSMEKFNKASKNIKNKRRLLPQDKLDNQIIFDSNFESGNLFAAFKVGKYSYDLVMQNDINSKGNNQWFYFSVEKMLQNVQYTFSIVNFTKRDSLFNYGMKPAYYSTMGNKKLKEQWYRLGENVSYFKGQINRENSLKYYYCLKFSITNRYSDDKVYIAHSYPYTFTMLNNFFSEIMPTSNNHIGSNMLSVNGNQPNSFVTKISIGTTMSGRQIPCLKICQKSEKKKDSRKIIIILARQHPGETQGSYVCEGVVKKLIEKASKKDKEGQFLRKKFITYVIPMVNIDGVIFGHYRTNLAGKDLNRKWDANQKQWTCPQVSAIKTFIAEIAKQNQIRFILDLHGHSKKYGSFFYGNPFPQNPSNVRIYPYICSRLNEGIHFMDCTFQADEYKKRAARIYLSVLYKQIHVYTFQSSFYGYMKNQKPIEFTPKEYINLGQSLVQALYIQLQHQSRLQILSEPKGKNSSQQVLSHSESGIGNPLFTKFQSELQNDAILLGIGNTEESGSQSNPEEGQVNNNDIVVSDFTPIVQSQKKQVIEDPRTCEKVSKNKKAVRISSKKHTVQYKQYSRPVRNIKFLALSQVNAVLPDKYHISLQPLEKKSVLKGISIDVSCQTQYNQRLPFRNYKSFQIGEKNNLVGELEPGRRTSHSKRHSQLMSSIQKNQIFRADLAIDEPLIRRRHRSERKNTKNLFTQTIISYRNTNCINSAKTKQKDLITKLTTQNEARIARMEQINMEVLRVYSRRSAVIDIGVKNKQRQKQKPINTHRSTKKQEGYHF